MAMALRAIKSKLTSLEPIWGLIAFASAIATVLLYACVRHYQPIEGPEIPWWAIAVLVLAAERWPVELEFRRSSHSFSLTDIPLSVALIFTSGPHAFVAITGGTVVALILRRLPFVKFCFNLAQLALVSSVMIVVVHVAAKADPGFGWLS